MTFMNYSQGTKIREDLFLTANIFQQNMFGQLYSNKLNSTAVTPISLES